MKSSPSSITRGDGRQQPCRTAHPAGRRIQEDFLRQPLQTGRRRPGNADVYFPHPRAARLRAGQYASVLGPRASADRKTNDVAAATPVGTGRGATSTRNDPGVTVELLAVGGSLAAPTGAAIPLGGKRRLARRLFSWPRCYKNSKAPKGNSPGPPPENKPRLK